MIAQIVFDLPLEGPFDYSVPEGLVPLMAVGRRVKVFFGPRPQIGFVTGILSESTIGKLKSVQSLADNAPGFNELDLGFAREFAGYYGCSLGEALASMLRQREDKKPSIRRDHQPQLFLYRCQPDAYARRIQEIIAAYRDRYQDKGDYCQFLILVPDVFRAQMLGPHLKGNTIKIGTRSSVFEADGRHDCVMMVDDEDSSYKQEQTPMYESRQVLLMRSGMYGFDIAFFGISPSVELMFMVQEKQVKLIDSADSVLKPAQIVDLTNYKFIPGMISPPVRDALERNLKAQKKSILILNRRGSYRLTRCTDCGHVLKCSHCDSPLIYSKSEDKYLCRHCTYTAPGETICPQCRKPSWKSIGIGVEQLQTEIKKQFTQAKIVSFERPLKDNKISLPSFDILIATNAVLRFQGSLKAATAAFIDFDAELNRLEMRSAFNAYSLGLHLSGMADDSLLIQTRNTSHYVLQALSSSKKDVFYHEELKLRKEFGVSPFKHWVKITSRGKTEKTVNQASQDVYNALSKSAPEKVVVTPPLADAVGRKRDQFRMNVMIQTDKVMPVVALIKKTFVSLKRPSRVITTINVDP